MELGNGLNSRRSELVFARKRKHEMRGGGYFSRLGGVCFASFGGAFVFRGMLSRCAAIYFARSANFYLFIFRNGAEQNGGLPP